ncbi:MAG: CBS domain-containing protein [Planctomycetes bacterium]|nr:CBS domain-containing protein [Planctomycetota bacterium]
MMKKRTLRHVIAGQKLLNVPPKSTVLAAAQTMAENNVGAVLVLVEGELAGIFTERDILRRVVSQEKDPAKTLIEEVMTVNPITIDAEEGVLDALARMREAQCRHLPVVDKEKVLGVLSLRDALMVVLELKEEEMKDLQEYLDYLPPESGVG